MAAGPPGTEAGQLLPVLTALTKQSEVDGLPTVDAEREEMERLAAALGAAKLVEPEKRALDFRTRRAACAAWRRTRDARRAVRRQVSGEPFASRAKPRGPLASPRRLPSSSAARARWRGWRRANGVICRTRPSLSEGLRLRREAVCTSRPARNASSASRTWTRPRGRASPSGGIRARQGSGRGQYDAPRSGRCA